MDTGQERELQLQGRQAWPFDTMATSLDASSDVYSGSSSSGSGGDCFVLGWEPPFGCFGLLAADAHQPHLHELFPLYMESLPVSPAVSAPPPPPPQDAAAVPEDLDDLLQNFWDASSSYNDVVVQQQVAFNSSCILQHEKSTATTTNSSSFLYDDDNPLGSIFSTGPTVSEKAVFQPALAAEPLLSSSSSSSCHADPHASDVCGSQPLNTTTPGGARALLPFARSTPSSLKRARPEETETETAECGESSSSKRRKAAASGGVVCPFAMLKPDGLNGGATLADINARILMRPARPVRHPVGEFACAPRASADEPGISGKAVSGFTRLHTVGRGTITIIRTRG